MSVPKGSTPPYFPDGSSRLGSWFCAIIQSFSFFPWVLKDIHYEISKTAQTFSNIKMKVECRSIIQQFSKVWILTFFLLCIFCKLVLLLNDQVAFTNIWASLHSLTYLKKQWGKKVHVVGVYRSCLIYFEDCHQSNRIIHLGKCLWVQSVRITFWFLTFYIWQEKKKVVRTLKIFCHYGRVETWWIETCVFK